MGYDDVITHLGQFGRYQKRIYFLVCLPAILCAFHKLAGVFLLAKPDFRCQLPFEQGTNLSYDLPNYIWEQAYAKDSSSEKYQTCHYYDLEYIKDSSNRTTTARPESALVPCDQYVYDTSKIKRSAVMEWNMVCNRSYMSASSDSLFMLGVLLGSIIFGQLSDKYGRKPIFFASLVIQLIFGVMAALAPDFITYTLARIVIGATTSGVFLVAYVIAMEMVGPDYRLFAGVVSQMFFSFGYILIALFAYFITDWRWLQVALTLPGVLFMCYHWIIPESARWLLSKNRKQEAVLNIQRIAKENKVHIPEDVLFQLLEDTGESKKPQDTPKREPSVLDLLRYPNLRRKTLLIFFDWFVNSGAYYGLSWSANNLGGNPLLNFIISGVVEFPAYTFLLCTLNRWGRRSILCGCMLVAGVALFLTIAVPADMNWLIVTLAMTGKLAITSSYGTVYIFSAEQFPTVIRNVALGSSSMVARVGGILAPYFNLLGEIWTPLPLIIFGGMSFVGGLLSLLLPETLNMPMLDTIEDGENFGKATSKVVYIEKGEEINEINKESVALSQNGSLHERQKDEELGQVNGIEDANKESGVLRQNGDIETH